MTCPLYEDERPDTSEPTRLESAGDLGKVLLVLAAAIILLIIARCL